MLKNTGIIFKNYLKTYIGSFASRKKKQTIPALVIIVLGLYLIGQFFFMNMLMIDEASATSEVLVYFAYNFTFIIIFSLMNVVLQAAKTKHNTDQELLLSMPVTKSEIIAGKILYEFFLQILIMLLMVIACFLPFVIKEPSITIFTFLRIIIIVIFLSLFNCAIAMLLAELINKITSKLRNGNIIRTIIMIAMITVYFLFTMTMSSTLSAVKDINTFLDGRPLIKFFYLLSKPNNLVDNIMLIIFCGVAFLFFIGSVFMVRKMYFSSQKTLSKEKIVLTKQQSVLTLFIKKELKYYFNSPLYVINSIIAYVILVIISVYVFVKGLPISIGGEIPNSENLIIVLMLAATSLSILLGSTTYPSISLEGNKIWIIKALPVNYKTFLWSKILNNMIIAGPFILVASILLALKTHLYLLPVYILIFTLCVLFTAIYGLIVNLRHHDLNWTSEIQPIKQGVNVMIWVLTTLGMGLILTGLLVVLTILSPNIVGIIIWIMILMLVDLILIVIINKKGYKLLTNVY